MPTYNGSCQPNPQRLDALLTIDGVDTYKRSDCRQYLQCLTLAADAGWEQFHCNKCLVYVKLPEEILRERDRIGAVALLLDEEDDNLDETEDDDVDDDASTDRDAPEIEIEGVPNDGAQDRAIDS